MRPLSQRSLAEWPLFVEELSGANVPVMEYFYSISTFEPLHDPHSGVLGLLKRNLI